MRGIEGHVRNQTIALTDAEFRECRDGSAALGRILACLLAEHHRVQSDLKDRRQYVVSEWERLQYAGLSPTASLMPLYYAVRCYLTYLKETPDSRTDAEADRSLFEQIDRSLSEAGLDPGKQVRTRIAEITSITAENKLAKSQLNPAVAAARVSQKATITAAIIAAGGALIVALLANWDKLWIRP